MKDKDNKTLAWKIGYIIGTVLAALVIIMIIGAIIFIIYPIARVLFIFLYWLFRF